MPAAREQMDALLGKARNDLREWERADQYTREEWEAAESLSRTFAVIDTEMSNGAELPSEWLAGAPDQGEQPSWTRDTARRYLEARYGSEGWRALDPFRMSNVLERWIWALASGNAGLAEECMLTIEEGLRQDASMKAALAAGKDDL